MRNAAEDVVQLRITKADNVAFEAQLLVGNSPSIQSRLVAALVCKCLTDILLFTNECINFIYKLSFMSDEKPK